MRRFVLAKAHAVHGAADYRVPGELTGALAASDTQPFRPSEPARVLAAGDPQPEPARMAVSGNEPVLGSCRVALRLLGGRL